MLGPSISMFFGFERRGLKAAHAVLTAIVVAAALILLYQSTGIMLRLLEKGANIRFEFERLGPIGVGYLGGMLVLLSAVGVSRAVATLALVRGAWWFAGLCLGLYIVLIAASKGPALAAVAALLMYWLVPLRVGRVLGGIAIAAVIAFGVVRLQAWIYAEYDFDVFYRFVDATEGDSESVDSRTGFYVEAWRDFLESPLLGSSLFIGGDGAYTHNLVLEAFMATGIVGGTAYLAMVALMLLSAVRLVAARGGLRVARAARRLLLRRRADLRRPLHLVRPLRQHGRRRHDRSCPAAGLPRVAQAAAHARPPAVELVRAAPAARLLAAPTAGSTPRSTPPSTLGRPRPTARPMRALAGGTGPLRVACLAACLVACLPASGPATADGPGAAGGTGGTGGTGGAVVPGWFGTPFGTPANVGAASLEGAPVALRFLADRSGCVRTLNFRWRFREPARRRAMYRAGDGGRYRVSLRADEAGAPAADALDAAEHEPVVADGVGGPIGEGGADVAFAGRACLEAGARYHLVFENLHPDPRNARVALSGPFVESEARPETLALPCPGCAETRLAVRDEDGAWRPYADPDRPSRFVLPHWCVGLEGGGAIGQPVQYGYAAANSRAAVYGDFRVRQTLRADAPPDGAADVSFLARKVVGDAPLEVRVNGRALPGPVVPGAAPGSGGSDGTGEPAPMPVADFAWYTVRAPAGAFGPGPAEIEFSTGAETAYELVAGTHSMRSCGADLDGRASGRAELSADAGAGWTGFTVFGQGDKPNVRLALYVVPVP